MLSWPKLPSNLSLFTVLKYDKTVPFSQFELQDLLSQSSQDVAVQINEIAIYKLLSNNILPSIILSMQVLLQSYGFPRPSAYHAQGTH